MNVLFVFRVDWLQYVETISGCGLWYKIFVVFVVDIFVVVVRFNTGVFGWVASGSEVFSLVSVLAITKAAALMIVIAVYLRVF